MIFNLILLLHLTTMKVLGVLMPKTIYAKEQHWYYLTHIYRYKGVHTFPKDIYPRGELWGFRN